MDLTLPTITIDQTKLTVSAEFVGLAPNRTINSGERIAGILALNPPTVTAAEDMSDVCRALTRATLAAIEATPGYELTPEVICRVSYSIHYALFDAVESLSV